MRATYAEATGAGRALPMIMMAQIAPCVYADYRRHYASPIDYLFRLPSLPDYHLFTDIAHFF